MHVMYDYVALEMPSLPGGNPADGDGDGLADSWESAHFRTLSHTAGEDPDGDGFTNAAEEAARSDPADAGSIPFVDADGDLIADSWELAHYPSLDGAGPLDDTDGDGFDTWTEWKAGTDPADGASKPGQAAGAAVLEPVADTAVWYRIGQPAYSAANYGTDPDIDNYSYPGVPIIALGYFRFDLRAVPAGAVIDSATLSFTKAAANPPQSPQGGHSDNGDALSSGRFALYGLTDVPGNTAQDWSESLLSGDTCGAEFDFSDAGVDPPVDTATRTVDLDGAGESVDGARAAISGTALAAFLQERLEAPSHPGLATFITDIEDSTSGKGYAFASREASADRPRLEIGYTSDVPVPDPDEDADGLPDAWEAHHFGTLARAGSGDNDQDGTPEWLEQALGLDPNNPGEIFRATVVESPPGAFRITWPNAAGVTFTVQSDDTLPGGWTTIEATVAGAPEPAMLSHPIVPDSDHRFYRISATRP